MKQQGTGLIINVGLLFWGSVMSFSGLLMQICYHIGNHGGVESNGDVLGISYSGWSLVHKTSIVVFSVFMIYHVALHRKWYKVICKKRLFDKNKPVFILTVIFILAVISGYIPWLMALTGINTSLHKVFIEIHDKMALFLFVFMLLHILKRRKRFI